SCLVYLTRYFENPYSEDVIRAGLSLTSEQLGISDFADASAKVGLLSRIEKGPLSRLGPDQLPAVLILKDEKACVLVQKKTPVLYKVYLPDQSAEIDISFRDLDTQYTGQTVFVSKIVKPQKTVDAPEKNASWPVWFFAAFSPHWWTYSQVMIAAFMINIFALASPLFIMNVYDRVLPNNSISSLWVMVTGVLIVFGFDFLLKNLRSFFIDHAGRKVDLHLANQVVDKVLDLRIADKPVSSGEYANLLRELESLRDFFTSASLMSIIDLPFVFIYILVFYIIAGPLAFVLITTLGLIIALGLLFHFPLQKSVFQSYHDGHRKHSILVEMVANLEIIKTLRAEGRFRKSWRDAILSSSESGARSRFLSQFVVNSASLIQQLAYISIVVCGVYLIQDNKITTGALIACVILNGRAMAPLAQITMLLTRLHHSYSSLKGLTRLMAKPVERPEDTRFLHRPELKPKIEFKNVKFSYPGGQIAALSNMSFMINPGEKVGIIGRSGSGKTTIGKLILGLYPLTSGSIRVDSTDIQQIDPVDLRRIAGVVTQDVALFQGTVRENILLAAPRTSDEHLLEIARIAGVDDFIRHHPSGYDLRVSERGEGLSGGQRQAIGIARALINDPGLLIMDEPTSAMDNSSELLLKKRLEPHLENRTLVLITHRMSLLTLVDRLIVVDMGKVVADGPKEIVLQNLSQNRIRVET
ncbi:MAG: type I secretion system permease/ATPase, partial [Proteobacteria bacterium]|nr:type I secretion system permease/ATPase [Pseudomonadota bacterium]